jgi:integrase
LEYLQNLLNDGKQVTTVKQRVSALAYFHPGHTFQGTLGAHSLVKDFLTGAKRKFPPRKSKVPTWDLPTALEGWLRSPNEPIQELPIDRLTMKTVFLLAVCSAKRVGEIQAFDIRDQFMSVGLAGVVLKTRDGFMPKVPTLANITKAVELAPYGIAADGSDLPERGLCVCRALTQYLIRTRPFRKSTQLFVSYGPKNKGQAASKDTIARWLKNAIRCAYETLDLDLPGAGLKAHSTRHASSSWAELMGVSVLDICQMMSWSTPHTFISHYKLDLMNSISSNYARAVLDVHHR